MSVRLTLIRATAVWACAMDWLHMKDSSYRSVVKEEPLTPRTDAGKQA